jgi:hypothetical protein
MLFSNNNFKSTYAWQTLRRVGGVAALTILALMPIQMVVFLIWPPPSTVIGWFTLFQSNALVGLIDMDLLLIVDYVLMLMVFLALWASLRRVNESLMAIALILQLVAVATYFASTTAFDVSYVVGAVALVLVSVVMLRSHRRLFSKATGYAGMFAGVLALVPASAGMIGLFLSLMSLVPTAIWLVLIARRLLQPWSLEGNLSVPSKKS